MCDFYMDAGIGTVKTVQVRDKKVAADRVAGSNAELSTVQGIGLQELIFPSAQKIHRRLNVF